MSAPIPTPCWSMEKAPATKELEGRISSFPRELRENRERMKDAGDVAEDFGDSWRTHPTGG
ncbi:MAG: hypothetical protein ACLSB9_30320 [Hydrogeniiclostridium mannosilyticum]